MAKPKASKPKASKTKGTSQRKRTAKAASKTAAERTAKTARRKPAKTAMKKAAEITPIEACRQVAAGLSATYPDLAADENSPLNWAIKVLTAAARNIKQ